MTDVEELIQSEELVKWDTDGNIILPTLNEVIRYCGLYAGMKYLPEDILENKVYEKYLKKPVLPVKSNPKDIDTDRDMYSDYEEVMVYNSDPITFNSLVSIADIDFLTDNTSYGASLCRDDYDESIYVEECVWIANNIFGSAHDYKLIYKESLLTYFKDVAEEEDGDFDIAEFLYFVNIGTQIEALASKTVKAYGEKVKPMFDYIVDEYKTTLLLFRNSDISSETFYKTEQKLLDDFLNNKYINRFASNRKIGAKFDDLDSINTYITIACIGITGLVSLNESYANYHAINNYRETILREEYVLDYIISDSKNEILVNTAKDVKYELESKFGTFLVESRAALRDFSYAVDDASFRYAVSISDIGAVIIASIAIFDWTLGVSDLGIKRIQCNAYATISDSVSNKLVSDYNKLERNSDYLLNGEYIIYDDFSLYASDLKCLYKSRYLGEEVVKGMNNGYSGLFIPEDYSQFIDSTLYKLNDVYLRSMSKYEK